MRGEFLATCGYGVRMGQIVQDNMVKVGASAPQPYCSTNLMPATLMSLNPSLQETHLKKLIDDT